MAVYLRKRKLRSGAVRVYLDLYHQGQRWYEFPANLIYTKETKREIMALGKRLAAMRQSDLARAEIERLLGG